MQNFQNFFQNIGRSARNSITQTRRSIGKRESSLPSSVVNRYSIENVRRISDVVKRIVLDSSAATASTAALIETSANSLNELSEVLLHSLNEDNSKSSGEESEHSGLFE